MHPSALVPALLTACAVALGFVLPREVFPGWLWMWTIAGALWLGFKFTSWRRAGGRAVFGIRTFPCCAWVGMDAKAFESRSDARHLPVLAPLLRAGLGATLLWGLAPALEAPIPRGWLGMIGLLLLCHFGLFDLLAAFWNRVGYLVEPIMDAPWRSRTLAEFWGQRWNRAFSDFARVALFRPLVRRFGIAVGTLAGFAFSGLAHELVISLPAGGGYGLPTLYFLLQGLGVLAERRGKFARHRFGRAFPWIAVLLPAGLLFHPPFLENVMHPFLQAIQP